MAKYKCTYELSESEFFINPYNFVPVNLQKTKRNDVMDKKEELHTGYLTCHIKCRTHLAIPDTEPDMMEKNAETVYVKRKQVKHSVYPFMKTKTGKPFISGSTVRGVIRNMYETITDSCFGTMKKDTIITVRSKDAFEPGLLIRQDKEWKLYQAKRHLLVVDENFFYTKHLDKNEVGLYKEEDLISQNGDVVNFSLARKGRKEWSYYSAKAKRDLGTYVKHFSKWDPSKKANAIGYICIGENAPRRHFHSIFEKMGLETNYPKIKSEDFQKLKTVVDEYKNKSVNKKYPDEHKGYEDYEKMQRNGVIPVYYMVQDGALYMSFAALGRKAFHNTLNTAVKEKTHQNCCNRKSLCPACALFGTVEGDALGSKVRFTDAKCIVNKGFESSKIVFGELSSPRVSYVPFYLKEVKSNSQNEERASFEKGYDSNELEIRGRKFYWHHQPELFPSQKIPKTDRNASFEVLKPNSEFEFRIYFEGITQEQLELLTTAVHLNENNEDGKLCQKMGHGKPLGYGSVKMTVQEHKERTFDLNTGWKEVDAEIYCADNWNAEYYDDKRETIDALKEICCFDAVKKWRNAKVEYPSIAYNLIDASIKSELGDNNIASHRWFTTNFGLGSKYPKQKFNEVTQDVRLKKYEILALQENCGRKDSEQSILNKNTQNQRLVDTNSSIQEQISVGEIFEAKILYKQNGEARNKPQCWTYGIELLNGKYDETKKYMMTASKQITLNKDQRVEVKFVNTNVAKNSGVTYCNFIFIKNI